MQNVELNFHSTMVKYQSVIRLEISPAVILKVFVENKLMTVNVIIALITEARLLEFNQNFNKRFNHSKFIRPVSSYATLGGGAPIRTASRHAIHLAYTARRFKCTN